MHFALHFILIVQGFVVVDYRFGVNYGHNFFDFSLNNREGVAFNRSSLIPTDRGLYFNENSNHIEVPCQDLPTEFSTLIWILMKSNIGLIYSNDFLLDNNFWLVFKTSKFEVYSKTENTLVKTWHFPSELNSSHWNLIKIHLKTNIFTVTLSNYNFEILILPVPGINSIKIGGNSFIKSLQMFIWSFLIVSDNADLDKYIGEKSNQKCLTTGCEPCVFQIKDEFYGTICLSTSTSAALNDSLFEKSCSCKDFCFKNILINSKACLNENGNLISGQACKSEYVFRSFKCCSGQCLKCRNSEQCVSCIDPFAEPTLEGQCVCKKGFFGTPSNSSISNCSKCSPGCLSCNIKDQCLYCSHQLNLIGNTCQCFKGFYLDPNDINICVECPKSCETCTKERCLSCHDQNSVVINDSCKCKLGYFLKNDSITCSECAPLCGECLNSSNCSKCSDPEARLNNWQCNCRQQFYMSSEDKICKRCSEDCQVCENEKICLECKSKDAFIIDGGCSCAEGFYNVSKLLYINSCKPCPAKCEGCRTNGECSSCRGNFTVLIRNSCLCLPGFFDPGENEMDCKKCVTYLESENCKLDCDPGSVWVTNKCISCPSFCLKCDEKLKCNHCQLGFRILNGKCGCLKGQAMKNLICVPIYFSVSLEVKQNNTIHLEFSEEPESLLNSSTFSLTAQSKEYNLTIQSLTSFSLNLEAPTFKAQRNLSTPFILTILYPIYSRNNSQLKDYSYSGSFYPLGPSSFAKLVKSTTQSALIASFASAMVSNPAACWILINTIQVIYFLPLSSVNYSEDIIEFIQAIGGYSFIPNWIGLLFDSDSSGKPNQRAALLGIKSSVFWVNFGSSLLVLMAYVALLPFIILGSQFQSTYEICRNWIKNYKFNLFIRFWIEIYLEVGIYALIQVQAVIVIQVLGSDKVVYFNSLTSSIVIVIFKQIIVCCTPAYSTLLMCRFRNLLNDLRTVEKFGSLFTEFKIENGVKGCLFYPVYFTRRLQFMFTQIFLVNFPVIQISLNLLGALGQFFYFIKFRPFKEKAIFLSELVGEVIILLVSILSILIFKLEDLANNKVMNYIFIYSVLLALAVQTFISMYILFATLKQVFLKLKKLQLIKQIKKSSKVYPEPPSHIINETVYSTSSI